MAIKITSPPMHPAGMDEPWDVPQVDLTLPRAFIFLSQRPKSPVSLAVLMVFLSTCDDHPHVTLVSSPCSMFFHHVLDVFGLSRTE